MTEQDHTPVRHSYAHDKENLLNRLRRIEGQVRGIQRMIEEDRYCVDVLIQVTAVKSAINNVGMTLLENHTRGCVASAVKSGDDVEVIDELMDVFKKFSN